MDDPLTVIQVYLGSVVLDTAQWAKPMIALRSARAAGSAESRTPEFVTTFLSRRPVPPALDSSLRAKLARRFATIPRSGKRRVKGQNSAVWIVKSSSLSRTLTRRFSLTQGSELRSPVRRRLGNQVYLLAGLFAHNLVRELQMRTEKQSRGTTDNRAALWVFEQVDTVRKTLLQRAGRLTRPGGKLTLTISGNTTVKARLLSTLNRLRPAA